MGRIRRCNGRCHNARGKRCLCWCGGAFHGAAGADNRQAIQEEGTDFLEKHGFEKGKTAYIQQNSMNFD